MAGAKKIRSQTMNICSLGDALDEDWGHAGLWRYKVSDKALALIKEGEFADYIWIAENNIYCRILSDGKSLGVFA